jgi:hypothetical protein
MVARTRVLQFNARTTSEIAVAQERIVGQYADLVVMHLVGGLRFSQFQQFMRHAGNCVHRDPLPPPPLEQSAYKDVQTLTKHALGLFDIRRFEETKASLQRHLEVFIRSVESLKGVSRTSSCESTL